MENCYGQKLNLIAVSFANAISKDLTREEITLLSAFFMLVGDALAVISAANDFCEKKNSDTNSIENS